MNGSLVARPWWLLPPGRIHPLWWLALGAAMLWIDHLTGVAARFPLMYGVPVILAAWYSGKWPALVMAIAVPLARLAFQLWPGQPEDPTGLALTIFRLVVVAFVGLWFARLAELERDLDLRVKVLEGLLPICSFCKSIRNEAGEWEHLEAFISRRSDAQFSHGVCPACGREHYPGLLEEEPQAMRK